MMKKNNRWMMDPNNPKFLQGIQTLYNLLNGKKNKI